MKKFITSILAICLFISLFTGCIFAPQNKQDENTEENSNNLDLPDNVTEKNTESLESENENPIDKRHYIDRSSISINTFDGDKHIFIHIYCRDRRVEWDENTWIMSNFVKKNNIHQIEHRGVKDDLIIFCDSLNGEDRSSFYSDYFSMEKAKEGLLSENEWVDPKYNFFTYSIFPEMILYEYEESYLSFEIYNVYCIMGYEYYIYYETSAGDFILFNPYRYTQQLYLFTLEELYNCAPDILGRGLYENYLDIIEPYAFNSKFIMQENTTTE